ncbi:major facilitator superfamily MFS_1 [Parvibaculum lavamentivorans DS-1]|uniref:Major facilitator superfamily MFS_1 n=1 Tax=Parvibaculum lavamentivorans (strain DS-1 / DSM 13023 / NCIMB 13966) TaxID=402881 RepID=A7HWN6_PARL1|nr:MFS transporter [Parvibaculum lavamentivorans]ABS64319.1 major facilitator superfamily MFS_1 [Parvibaculum lavamentivorans DS-1]
MRDNPEGEAIECDVPARLDRLPWGRFHTLVVAALGITWILDGLEVTLAGAVAGALRESPSLDMNASDIGLAASAYLVGAVFGGVFFGWLTDRFGRRKLFFITLALYVAATIATAFSWSLASFAFFRFLTGAGIGGEYTAINSTIQELIPARFRGWTDLAINGSFWLGAALGAGLSIVLLDPDIAGGDLGWRLCFFIGGVLGLFIFAMRFWLPESPRWLMTHGRVAEASGILADIEGQYRRRGHELAEEGLECIKLRQHRPLRVREIFHTLFQVHRRRALVGLALMSAQAFFYNAIFFTYALVLTDFYDIPAAQVGWYILPFAAGNFFGPLILGRLFDTVGRRIMIASTYAISGVLLACSGYMFAEGLLTAQTQTIAWMVIFFFASAAASSAYLTVSETFPLEMRAVAIAVFYAVGTGLGGVAGPALFGWLIESGSRDAVFGGYLVGAGFMTAAAIVQAIWGVAAERQALETVTKPLRAWD